MRRPNMYGFYAMSYLNQWLKNDSHWHRILNSDQPRSNKLGAIKEAATYYRVARNWRQASEEDGRYGAILDFLDSAEPPQMDSIAAYVTKSAEQLRSLNGDRNVLSLTSKMLWVKFKSPVVIYDTQAKRALGLTGDDYSKFVKVWHDHFSVEKNAIEVACAQLENAIRFCVRPDLHIDEFRSFAFADFFMERVFDIRLWTEGVQVGLYTHLSDTSGN